MAPAAKREQTDASRDKRDAEKTELVERFEEHVREFQEVERGLRSTANDSKKTLPANAKALGKLEKEKNLREDDTERQKVAQQALVTNATAATLAQTAADAHLKAQRDFMSADIETRVKLSRLQA